MPCMVHGHICSIFKIMWFFFVLNLVAVVKLNMDAEKVHGDLGELSLQITEFIQ